jgi:hypothetical protein
VKKLFAGPARFRFLSSLSIGARSADSDADAVTADEDGVVTSSGSVVAASRTTAGGLLTGVARSSSAVRDTRRACVFLCHVIQPTVGHQYGRIEDTCHRGTRTQPQARHGDTTG